jgi:hypothetical protein
MLFVYAGLNLRECDRRIRLAMPPDCIDMSRTTVDAITANIRTVCMHSLKKTSIYLGFLDPLLMLSLPDEALCRQAFRTVDVYVVVSNPFILPLSWKNGIAKLVVVGKQYDAPNTQTLDDSCPAHVSRAQG